MMGSRTAGDFSRVSRGNHFVAEFNILLVQRWNIYKLLAGMRSGAPPEGKVRLEMPPSIHLHRSISVHVLGSQQQRVRDRHNGDRLPPRPTPFPLFDQHVLS